jgi:hypothetical protein
VYDLSCKTINYPISQSIIQDDGEIFLDYGFIDSETYIVVNKPRKIFFYGRQFNTSNSNLPKIYFGRSTILARFNLTAENITLSFQNIYFDIYNSSGLLINSSSSSSTIIFHLCTITTSNASVTAASFVNGEYQRIDITHCYFHSFRCSLSLFFVNISNVSIESTLFVNISSQTTVCGGACTFNISSVFTENVYPKSVGNVDIFNCSFEKCASNGSGGAMYLKGLQFKINLCKFRENSCRILGKDIFIFSSRGFFFSKCKFFFFFYRRLFKRRGEIELQ